MSWTRILNICLIFSWDYDWDWDLDPELVYYDPMNIIVSLVVILVAWLLVCYSPCSPGGG